MRATAERVAAYWRGASVPGAPGATTAGVTAFQERHGLSLPCDVGTLYSLVNGNECDRCLFRVWPLAELERITVTVPAIKQGNLADAQDYFGFADWMLQSHLFAVRLRPDIPQSGPVVWVMGSRHGVVASSFQDFWECYLNDPEGTTRACA